MHGHTAPLGGDLRNDTVTIIGATLDLQDKTVKMAMTPIDKVVMLHIDAKLDYETLRWICATGHSRIPVYEDIEVDAVAGADTVGELGEMKPGENTVKTKVKKIVGILLVKQCVLLDPEGIVAHPPTRTDRGSYSPSCVQMLYLFARCASSRCPSCPRTSPSWVSSIASRRAAPIWR